MVRALIQISHGVRINILSPGAVDTVAPPSLGKAPP
jgi:hypothetical protein